MYTCIHTYIHIYECIYIYVYIRINIYVYVCINIYMYTYIYICIYMSGNVREHQSTPRFQIVVLISMHSFSRTSPKVATP